jgi:hypothetical protein
LEASVTPSTPKNELVSFNLTKNVIKLTITTMFQLLSSIIHGGRTNNSKEISNSLEIPMKTQAFFSLDPIREASTLPETRDIILVSEQNIIFRPRPVNDSRRRSFSETAQEVLGAGGKNNAALGKKNTNNSPASERAQAFNEVLVLRAERAERRKSITIEEVAQKK